MRVQRSGSEEVVFLLQRLLGSHTDSSVSSSFQTQSAVCFLVCTFSRSHTTPAPHDSLGVLLSSNLKLWLRLFPQWRSNSPANHQRSSPPPVCAKNPASSFLFRVSRRSCEPRCQPISFLSGCSATLIIKGLVHHANFRPMRKSKEGASVTGSLIRSVSDEQLPVPELCQRGEN